MAAVLPAGLLGPRCAACRVNSLREDVPYEARVTYFAVCGCRSHPSLSSLPCHVAPAVPQTLAPSPVLPDTPQAMSASESPIGAWSGGTLPVIGHGLIETMPPLLGTAAPPFFETSPSLSVPETPHAVGAHSVATVQMPPPLPNPVVTSYPPPPLPPCGVQLGSTPGWRCIHGGLIPAPCAPELIPFEEAGRSILIQWPTVVHSVAYTVELFEEGSAAIERFQRAVPEGVTEPLVELRIGNLQPGSYGACVRGIAPCGCESAPSPWSFCPPVWPSSHHGWGPVPPVPVTPAPEVQGVPAPSQPPPAQAPVAAVQQQQPAYLQPPSALLSTSPTSLGAIPPPPMEPPDVQPAVLPSAGLAPAVPVNGGEALVLD